MMGRALLIIGALATLGFLACGVLGYLLKGPADPGMTRHVFVALVSCLAQLFSHCWIVVYLIITGRAIRETVEEYGLEERYLEEVGGFKTSVVPWAVAAVVLGVATFLLGGATVSGEAKSRIHHALSFVTVAVQGWTLWRESRALGSNQALIDEVDRRLPARPSPGSRGQEVAG